MILYDTLLNIVHVLTLIESHLVAVYSITELLHSHSVKISNLYSQLLSSNPNILRYLNLSTNQYSWVNLRVNF